MENSNSHVHIIEVTRNDDTSSISSNDDQPPRVELPQHENTLSSSTHAPTQATSTVSSRLNSRSSSFLRRNDGYSHRSRSPLNSGLWISVEFLVTMSQIIASIVVLSLSTNENPQAPLFAWVVGYASGCVAALPLHYWRFRNRNRDTEVDTTQSLQGTSEHPPESVSYTAISISRTSDEESNRTLETVSRIPRVARFSTARLDTLLDHYKMVLNCFFAVWFVVGNVWIFGVQASPSDQSDAPKLYRYIIMTVSLTFTGLLSPLSFQVSCRLCIVFLTFSCIGYAMPFILCATICFCLPCIISFREFQDLSQTRGATAQSINALPTYKFKSKRDGSNDSQETAGGGGLLAAGTDNERPISEEDAVCSICLANYSDNDELRELTCTHVFHVECVDKWLKINASCPLCKSEVGVSNGSTPDRDSSEVGESNGSTPDRGPNHRWTHT